MDETEVDRYLAESGQLCRLGTVDSDGAPYVVPIWFLRDGDRIYVTAREKSLWLEHIRADPRVCASIDEQVLPHRKVTVRAQARIAFEVGHDGEWLDLYRTIVGRYWEEPSGTEYIESTRHLSRALVEIPFAFGAEGVTNWRSLEDGDDYAGIWAKRYWEPHVAGREREGAATEGRLPPSEVADGA